jgi:hypothetical protein
MDDVSDQRPLHTALSAILASDWALVGLLLLVAAVVAQMIFIYRHKFREDKHDIYGNWSQTAAAAAATILGLSSLAVSFNTYSLQQTLRADATMDRAARSIQYAHAQRQHDNEYVETHIMRPALRDYDCIKYLVYRLQYTPDWFIRPGSSPYPIEFAKLGTPPEKDPDTPLQQRDTLSKKFWTCLNMGDLPQPNISPEMLGARIKHLIRIPLQAAEIALGEWAELNSEKNSHEKNLNGARRLLLCEIGNDLCGSSTDKEDVFTFFEEMHKQIDANTSAADFSKEWLEGYRNLSDFLKYACRGLPSKVERDCSSESWPSDK